MEWEVLDSNYISSLFEEIYSEEDNKLVYIRGKAKRRGFDHLTLNEYNYIRKKSQLPEISIKKINELIYENLITYTYMYKETGISRTMLSMVLRGTRNTTICALNKICNAISKKNPKVDKSMIME